MIGVSFILMYVWPIIFSNLQHFGETISGLGDVGAGLYGFFNRLLIPVGLHHALNSVFWFDVAGINDIPNFLAGQQTIVEFAAEGKTAVGTVGMYQAGFFPIMMFGLPGAALAIYISARKENKEKVASIMIAAALASFFTGVTEPLEFSFMFVAPLLYVVHALLTGVSVYIAAHMEWMAGFGFSAGFVDMVLSSKNPLAKQWYMLLAQGVVFFGLYYVVFMGLIKKLNLKTPGRERESTLIHESEAKKGNELVKGYDKALGGIKNIETIDACITRLRLTLTDRTKIKEADMKALGAMGVVKLGENNLQVIIGPQAESIANAMKEIK
jgi:PTS system N-acetylglucosamine-specific IIC component